MPHGVYSGTRCGIVSPSKRGFLGMAVTSADLTGRVPE
jgi:hypothetical protein